MPADPAADSDLFRALQGTIRYHRNASCAVLRLDSRPFRHGPDDGFQPVRPDRLDAAGLPDDRGVADHDDAGHAGPAQYEPAAAGPDSGQNGRMDALPDDLHHGEIRRRAGDLLD